MKAFCNFFLFFCVVSGALYGGIEKHFKKAEGKSELHKIKNVDFIYMINLDQRPEKFSKAANQLYAYGIHPYRFSAVNGWELSIEAINDVGVKYEKGMTGGHRASVYSSVDSKRHDAIVRYIGTTYFDPRMSRGAIGIVLSHLSILQDGYDSGYETIWVMEDDIEVIQNPHLVSDLIEKLDGRMGKEGWDILFTDRNMQTPQGEPILCSSYGWRPNFNRPPAKDSLMLENIDGDFRKIGARYGAHSMIIRRSGMKKILDFLKTYKIYLPYDVEYILPPGIKIFTVQQDVVANQLFPPSDNGEPNYLKKEAK